MSKYDYIKDFEYVDKRTNATRLLPVDDIRDAYQASRKIHLIKELRMVSGMGLKDSKDAIEDAMDRGSVDNVLELFFKYTGNPIPDPYTKEEFMHLVEECVDSMDYFYFDDMLEAVQTMLANVKKQGGLVELAKQRDRFLGAI